MKISNLKASNKQQIQREKKIDNNAFEKERIKWSFPEKLESNNPPEVNVQETLFS
jgi:hypothetical protein